MTRLLAACVIAALGLISPAVAQNFPSKLIRIIVPFTPGGSNDVVAREIATGLQERLKQTVVVENKPGGGGVIAYHFVAKSPPDGYIMLIAPASFTMGPHLSKQPALQSGHRIRPDRSGRRRALRHGGAADLAGADACRNSSRWRRIRRTS